MTKVQSRKYIAFTLVMAKHYVSFVGCAMFVWVFLFTLPGIMSPFDE